MLSLSYTCSEGETAGVCGWSRALWEFQGLLLILESPVLQRRPLPKTLVDRVSSQSALSGYDPSLLLGPPVDFGRKSKMLL